MSKAETLSFIYILFWQTYEDDFPKLNFSLWSDLQKFAFSQSFVAEKANMLIRKNEKPCVTCYVKLCQFP